MMGNVEQNLYEPLDNDGIRLLKFSSQSSVGNDLIFEFEYSNVSGFLPRYTAISYAWGNSLATEIIHVNGRVVLVRPHVLKCLQTLVKPCQKRQSWSLIWIDSICINQQDEKEKASQVRLMGHIYLHATVVSVWLQTDCWGLTTREVATECEPRKTQWPSQYRHAAYSPYWERTWVIQEFLLAVQVHIYGTDCRLLHQDKSRTASTVYQSCFKTAHKITTARRTSISCAGGVSYGGPGPEFGYWLRGMMEEGPHSVRKPAFQDVSGNKLAFSGFQGLMLARYDTGAVIHSFSSMLLAYADTRCLLPQDKIFSIMSLLSDKEFRALARVFPDYSVPESLVAIISLTHIKVFGDNHKLETTARENKQRGFALRIADSVIGLYRDDSMSGKEIMSRLSLEVSKDQDSQAQSISVVDLIDWLAD